MKNSMKSLKTSTLTHSDIAVMIKLLGQKYHNIESKSFRNIAILISKEFKVSCTQKMVESYYEVDEIHNPEPFGEDFELESRKIENGYVDRD